MTSDSAEKESSQEDLYKLFGVEKTATQDDIKKAYRKLCLKYHPDKLSNLSTQELKEEATKTFQHLASSYAILSDPIRRSRYDSTGYIGDQPSCLFEAPGGEGWDAYFRELWAGLVTKETITEFEAKYKGSNEESNDVISAYLKGKGSMDTILNTVPLSTPDDEDRFREIISKGLETQYITERYEKFFKIDVKATERRRKAAVLEEKAFERAEKKRKASLKETDKNSNSGKNGENEESLSQLIQKRGESRFNDLIAGLEAKEKERVEGKKKKGFNSKKEVPVIGEPTEEEFAALQEKLFSKNKEKGKSSKAGKKEVKEDADEEDEEVEEKVEGGRVIKKTIARTTRRGK